MKKLIFALFFSAFSTSNANADTNHIYIFEVELTTHSGTEGPILVRLAENHPAKLTSPSGHVVEVTLREVIREDRVLTEIESSVSLASNYGKDTVYLPKMMISGTGEASLAPRGDQGDSQLEVLRVTLASVSPASEDEIELLKSLSHNVSWYLGVGPTDLSTTH